MALIDNFRKKSSIFSFSYGFFCWIPPYILRMAGSVFPTGRHLLKMTPM